MHWPWSAFVLIKKPPINRRMWYEAIGFYEMEVSRDKWELAYVITTMMVGTKCVSLCWLTRQKRLLIVAIGDTRDGDDGTVVGDWDRDRS